MEQLAPKAGSNAIAVVAQLPVSHFFERVAELREAKPLSVGLYVNREINEHVIFATKHDVPRTAGAPGRSDMLFAELMLREAAGLLRWAPQHRPICARCNKVFETLAEFSLHTTDVSTGEKCGMLLRIGKANLACVFCNTQMKTRGNLKRHAMFQHSGEIPRVDCDFCDKSFCNTENMRRHVARRHPVEWGTIHMTRSPNSVRSPPLSDRPARRKTPVRLPGAPAPPPTADPGACLESLAPPPLSTTAGNIFCWDPVRAPAFEFSWIEHARETTADELAEELASCRDLDIFMNATHWPMATQSL